jgi:hypothetical protein
MLFDPLIIVCVGLASRSCNFHRRAFGEAGLKCVGSPGNLLGSFLARCRYGYCGSLRFRLRRFGFRVGLFFGFVYGGANDRF